MAETVSPCQQSRRRCVVSRTAVRFSVVALLLPLLQSACVAQTQSLPTSSSQVATPQIVTVPVPSGQASGLNSTSPDWGQTAQSLSRANAAPDTSSTTGLNADSPRMLMEPAAPPTEFQQLVRRTTGQELPIFGSNLFRNAPSTFAPISGAQVTADYVIGPGDEIRLSATGQLNQQGSFMVDRAGTISIPQVGTLTVSGLRFDELKPFLMRELGRVYRNFQLNVTLGQTRSIQVYVTGEARRPGSYTISSLSTLLNAVFASGGVLPQGSMRAIQLVRGRQIVSTLDLYDLLLRGDKTHDVTLQPGDIIFIPKAGPQVAVTGSVTNPAIYELRGETTVAGLLSLANGATNTALETNARVESIFNHAERTVTEVNLQTGGDHVLHDGDILTVQAISGRFLDAVTLRGNVTFPGRYTWRSGLRLSDVIPNRDALFTREYYRARNQLGEPQPTPTQPQTATMMQNGPAMRSTTGTRSGAQQAGNGQYGSGQYGNGQTDVPMYGKTAQSNAANDTSSLGQTDTTNNAQQSQIPQYSDGLQPNGSQSRSVFDPTTQNTTTANNNGSGTSVAEALTQSNERFKPKNTIAPSAPDVDLSYAVIERLNPATLTTTLVPFNLGKMLSGDTSQNLELQPGDVVTVFSQADIRVPQAQQTRFVRLEGEFVGSGIYSVLPGETLRQLVARAGGLTPDAYLYASEFTRESTRRIEQQRLREFADTLESQISTQIADQLSGNATATGNFEGAAEAANAAATSGRALVNRLRTMQPDGRVVLSLKPDSAGLDSIPDIPLEDGDRFIVPREPSTITVSGQVYNASAFLYKPHAEVREYLRDAGGPQRDADEQRIFLVRADGSVVSRQYNHVERAQIFPGDTIIVPPRLTHANTLRNIVLIASLIGTIATPLSLLAVVLR